MTPANPDALADALAACLDENDHRSRQQEVAALIAGPLAPILADLQRVTAERDEALIVAHTMREGVRDAADEATHHRNNCLIAQREKAAAEARAAQLQAEVEARKARDKEVRGEAAGLAAVLCYVSTYDNPRALRDLCHRTGSFLEKHVVGSEPLARAATAREGQTHTPASGALKIKEADRA